jgi:hypothetical protein
MFMVGIRETPAPDWQPIETAPKDGTVILLFCPQGDGSPGSTLRVTAGHWLSEPGGTVEHRDIDGRYIGQDDNDGWEGWLSWDGGFSEDTMMPTHWMPLPAPPVGSQANLADANSNKNTPTHHPSATEGGE